MKKIYILLLLLIFSYSGYAQDTTSLKYFPLKTGNRWTWYRTTTQSPGPGFEVMRFTGVRISNSHIYHRYKYDIYGISGNLYSTYYGFDRIDSASGNLYSYDSVNNSECMTDSLESQTNDSALTNCYSRWYRCNVGTYSIFNINPSAKTFSYSDYFEGGNSHIYAMKFGRVFANSQGPFPTQTWTLYGCLINDTLYGDTSIVLGINKINEVIPKKFSLSQNYPNPFNPVTKIKVSIAPPLRTNGADLPLTGGDVPAVAGSVGVKLVIYDALGREVATLVDEQLKPGTYEVNWDGKNYPSGVYFYKLESEVFLQTKKMMLLK